MPRKRSSKKKAPIRVRKKQPILELEEPVHYVSSSNKKRKKPEEESVSSTVYQLKGRRVTRSATLAASVSKEKENGNGIGVYNSNEEGLGIMDIVAEYQLGIEESSGEGTFTEDEPRIEELFAQGSSKPKKIVHFNRKGQPIGDCSTSFVNCLGSMARKHCPIFYEHWRDVPDQIKEMIWKLITDEYLVSATYKVKILQRINKHWREFKSKLRVQHYDKYDTDEERKRNCPRGVQHGDWDRFVHNQATPNAQARRGKGKSAREALKTPHTYGRRGAARTIEALATKDRVASWNHQPQSASPDVSGSGPVICEDPCSSKQKKMVYFNDNGQPIGEGSASFTSSLGSLTRKHCPISYEKWRDVPDEIKEKIWKLVTDEFIITAAFKEHILTRINKHWREFKCQLRSKHYDMYNTDEERKENCPRGVNQDVWGLFVDNQSTATAQARRRRGKTARGAMKSPHTSGRRGAARTAEDLKKKDPSAIVTRTDLYLATHSRKDGSYPTPELSKQVEQIKAIIAEHPSSAYLDVDHDPVAQVCGPEGRGRVRGMGNGVSKSAILFSAPAKDQLEEAKRIRLSLEEQIADLKEQLVACKKQFIDQGREVLRD